MLSGKFICATFDYSTYTKFVPSPLFRKTFVVYEKPKKGVLTIGCTGFYDVYINGHKITKGIIAPYISNPDHIVYYDRYDITEFLCEGRNVLGLQLGNGMQNAVGGQTWSFDKADFRGAPRVAFSVELENNDGTVDVIEANRSVKTAPSSVIFDDLRCGCFCDARNEIQDWAQIKFDDNNWADAYIAETPRGEKRICTAEPVTPIRHIRPISVRKCVVKDYKPRGDVVKDYSDFPSKEREGWLYDFGINTAGIERLKIKGERGQKIDLQFGEYLDENGNPDISNINFFPDGFSQRDIYILSGNGEEIFEPKFTYHGFRYCVVFGITDEQATPDLLTYIVCSSALTERGNFHCSDDIVNRLQAMTRNSTLSNFYYFPTDCPHREKNGWTGDASASCRQTHLNLSPEKSYREWLANIRKAQKENGEIPGIVPTAGWGYEWGNGPYWDAALINLPYYTYIYRGDKEILEENADALFRYANYISRNRTPRGTVGLGLGDWLPITVIKSPLEFTDSVITMDNMKKTAYIFGVLGMELQKEFCLKLYGEIKAAVRKYLIDFKTMTAIGRCQTSQSAAIIYDVFEESEKPQAFKVLLDIVKESDDFADVGFVGFLSIYRTLCEYGEADLAYKMIARPEFPSFGNCVKRGYTALPEDFQPENKLPNSLNHHFYGDISAVFIEYFAGIRVNPYCDDCKEVNIQPCFVKKLTEAVAFYETVCGRVSVKWERTYGGIRLTVEKPDGIYGKIILPKGCVFDDTQTDFRKFEEGVFNITDKNCEPENIIEV